MATGENPGAADAAGVAVVPLRIGCVMFGCAMAALAGAYLTLVFVPSWSEGITAGRGWIAIALVIFAAYRPIRVAVSAFFFGLITAFGFTAQLWGWDVPSAFLSSLPYVATLVIMLVPVWITLKGRRTDRPAALVFHIIVKNVEGSRPKRRLPSPIAARTAQDPEVVRSAARDFEPDAEERRCEGPARAQEVELGDGVPVVYQDRVGLAHCLVPRRSYPVPRAQDDRPLQRNFTLPRWERRTRVRCQECQEHAVCPVLQHVICPVDGALQGGAS